VGQAALVCKEELERRKAGLNGHHVSGCTHETIGHPFLDLVPECGELPRHVDFRYEGVHAIAVDREEEGGGQPMAEEGGEAYPWGGESFDRHKSCLGLG